MKSLLTFLAFNVVLLICCYEKKCAGSMQEPAHIEPVNLDNTFMANFNTDKSDCQKCYSRMHMVIMNGFVNGYYCEEDMRRHISVVGAVRDGKKIILFESENGEITRTFQGGYQKRAKGLMLISGIWKSTNSKMMSKSDDDNILPDSDLFQAVFLPGKRQ
ncbi:hypothetical protein [Dyadobacter sp. CY356]|uniref:hypothetical protein n=1 Tax=Dyadobacter sp. CY356 TaxID=2906442 RepID=UPI001F3A2ABC|nr:hypothetical protein [Dyadobacter sp. CY356]MCF0054938.1 hypothetical protein [Dyadobacter sp. CY356]